MTVVPAATCYRLECAGQALELWRRQRREDGDQAQQLDLHLRHVGGAVDAAQALPHDGDDHHQEHGGADQRGRRAAEPDQGGHEDRPEGEADAHQRLEQGEHLAEYVGRRGALQEDAPGDVEHGAAHAGDGEQHEGAGHGGEEAEQPEGERRRDDAGDERRREAPPRDERCRRRRRR